MSVCLISLSHHGNKLLTYFFSYVQVNNRVSACPGIVFPLDGNFWYRTSLEDFLSKPIVLPDTLALGAPTLLHPLDFRQERCPDAQHRPQHPAPGRRRWPLLRAEGRAAPGRCQANNHSDCLERPSVKSQQGVVSVSSPPCGSVTAQRQECDRNVTGVHCPR